MGIAGEGGLGHRDGGGHGGGHHGGGHHGGGHHHHGGGAIYAGGYGYNYPYRYPPPEVLVVTQTPPPCPQVWAPVLANDGKLYRNACAANRAGVLPTRSARKHETASQAVLGRLGEISPVVAVGGIAIAAVALALGYGAIMREHRRRRR